MKIIATVLLWGLAYLILISASNYLLLQAVYINTYSATDIALANLFLLIFIAVILKSTVNSRHRFLLIVPFVVLFLVICLAFTEVIIYKFSGVGFNEQTFLHLEPESLFIAFKMNPIIYSMVILGVLLWCILLLFSPPLKTSATTAWILIIISLSGLYFTALGSAIGRFVTGYYQFNYNVELSGLTAKEVEPYRQFGIHPVYQDKASIQAEFKSSPKNLIVIYLESFSHIFSASDRYPDLTPHINQLKDTYGELENYQSTALITIQGLVSSQCGLIPQMLSGNNISKDQIQYQKLPCLANVLHQLDYQQEFIGGAKKHFANKALHLESMGFDKVWGWHDYDVPSDYQANSWGLQDGELFSHALERIKYLNEKDQPFHVSLLTLSTHLNGNPDPTCPKYASTPIKNEFLDGIHCTDYMLGRFIDNLKEQDILDDTTVFITGDHGVFDVDLIKELFGTDFNRNKLLGILINGLDFDTTLPLGLYDMAPMLMDSLNIDTNINFINGLSPGSIDHNRFLLRHNSLTPKDQLAPGCNKADNIAFPLDKCENERLMTLSWAHAATFTPNIVWNKTFDPSIRIKSSQQKQQAQLIINGQDQTPLFLVNGYPINTHKRRFNHHIFLLVYDKKNNKIVSRNAYKYTATFDYIADYLRDQLNHFNNNKDVILFIYTEGGRGQSPVASWDAVFEDLGSQHYNFPQEPYIGIIQYTEQGRQLMEWRQQDGHDITRRFSHINNIDFNTPAIHE